MSGFVFQPLPRPFPRWLGPFSPARGVRSGFRFSDGQLGTWVANTNGWHFWRVDGEGARTLAAFVRGEWGGGRVLLLPNGFVIKPLQDEAEAGRRALIGRFHGPLKLEGPSRSSFDLSNPGPMRPGDPWQGPITTGLECVIQPDGGLVGNWYHPAAYGRDEVSEQLRHADPVLTGGFRAARSGGETGRVRITANGHVITNRQSTRGDWECRYVGYVAPASWQHWERWIGKELA